MTADEQYMRLALSHAKNALAQGWIPVGAVFVRDGKIVSHGIKTGTVHPLFDHAEHNGCYQALWSSDGPSNLNGCTVYSTLEPCILCMAMLMTTRVSRIVYAFPDPYGGGSFLLHKNTVLPERFRNERPSLTEGVLRNESKKLLVRFFKDDTSRGGRWSNPNNPLRALALQRC